MKRDRENTNDFFFAFFWGSGVCVLRCFCESRNSFCLYHATGGYAWSKMREIWLAKSGCQKCSIMKLCCANRLMIQTLLPSWIFASEWMLLIRLGSKIDEIFALPLHWKSLVVFFHHQRINILLSFGNTRDCTKYILLSLFMRAYNWFS